MGIVLFLLVDMLIAYVVAQSPGGHHASSLLDYVVQVVLLPGDALDALIPAARSMNGAGLAEPLGTLFGLGLLAYIIMRCI